jgi:hypothetical protein
MPRNFNNTPRNAFFGCIHPNPVAGLFFELEAAGFQKMAGVGKLKATCHVLLTVTALNAFGAGHSSRAAKHVAGIPRGFP